MKKIIYLGLCVLLAVSFGCSKDEILSEQENSNIEQKVVPETNYNQRFNGDTTENQPIPTTDKTIPLPGADEYIYYLYLNMDAIENEYNSDPTNPSYTGPFNIFYRNLMSTHFTIYQVQESNNPNSACQNVERWKVNLDELNQHLISIGFPEIDPDDNGFDWYILGDPVGNTSSTTLHDVNGTPKKPKGSLPPPPDTTGLPQWLVYSYSCFTL